MQRSESHTDTTSAAKITRRRVGRKTAGSVALAVVLAFGLLWWFGGTLIPASGTDISSALTAQNSVAQRAERTATASTPEGNADAADTAAAQPLTEEQKLARQIVGEWEQINKGKRLLTVRDDGTATMKVTLDGAWSYVVGEKLEFEIEWKIEGKRVLFHMTSGKPEGSMKVISSIYGNDRNHRIDELTSKQMILVDEQDESHDKWTRIASAGTGTAK